MIDVETYAAAKKYVDEHGGGGGTTNYNALDNKPQIAGTTLQGNKTLNDLGIAGEDAIEDVYAVMGEMGAKNLIPYPYYEASGKDNRGIVFTYGTDGIMYMNGTSNATNQPAFTLAPTSGQVTLKKSKTYVLYCDSDNEYVFAFMYFKNSDGTAKTITYETEYSNGTKETRTLDYISLYRSGTVHKWAKFTLSDNSDYNQIDIRVVAGSHQVNNAYGKVMLIDGRDIDLTWKIFAKTNKQLTDDVTSNAEAIEAMVNVNGCCNIAPTFTSATVNGRTFTVSSDGTVTVTGAGDGTSVYYSVNLPKLNENCQYILNGCPLGGDANKYALSYSNSVDGSRDDFGSGIEFTPYDYSLYPDQNLVIYINGSYSIQTPLVFKPMLYDARLNPTGYVPYAMTNRELTERVIKYRTVDISNIAITAVDNGVYYSDLISIGQIDHVHIMSVSQVSPWWSNLGFVIVNGCGVALTSAVSWTTPANTYMRVYYYED